MIKLEFTSKNWIKKNLYWHHEFDSFPKIKDFYEETDDMYKSVNQYFSNNQSMKSKNYAWVWKDLLKA